MSFIQRADAWIVTRIYQPLVDFSGLTPAWWVRCMGILLLCIEAARLGAGFRPEGFVLVAWLLGVLMTAAVVVGLPAWAVKTMRVHSRQRLFCATFMTISAAFSVALLALASLYKLDLPQSVAIGLVADFPVASVLFFGVCKDPPPPRRNTKPALATSGYS